MHSGMGPKDVLNSANVPVEIELPGVGQHLQDHIVRVVCFVFESSIMLTTL